MKEEEKNINATVKRMEVEIKTLHDPSTRKLKSLALP